MTLAPTVRQRETQRPTFPAVVLTYTDALRLLADSPAALSPAQIADATDRVVSNVRRDIAKLRDAGVIEIANTPDLDTPPTWTITDKAAIEARRNDQ
jgi:predicted transcriptional regulator